MADPIHIGAPDGSVVEFPGDTSDETIKSVMAKHYPPPATPASAESPSVAADVAKSGGIGLAKGAIGLAGMAGDLTDLGAKGIEKASNFINDKLGLARYERPTEPSVLNNIPTADSLQKAVESQTGDFYQPKTVAGQYAQTAGEFAPALIGGPESLLAKATTRVALPAAISETAGQLTKGTAAEPYARVVGALMSPLASGGVERAANAVNGRVEGMSQGAAGHLISAVGADGPAAVQAKLAELGPDAMLPDAGAALLGKAQGASLNSDEGRSILQTALTRRNVGTNARIQGDVDQALGPAQGDAQTITDAITAHRSAIDGVNYPTALNNAPPVKIAPIMTDLIDRIDQTPTGSMEHKALSKLQEMLTRTEKQPLLDAEGIQQYDKLGNERWQDVARSHDDAGVLHKVKMEIDNVVEHDKPGLGVQPGALNGQQAALKQVRHSLNDALETQVPGYANANAVSAALAKRATAVDLGTQYLGAGKTIASPERFAAAFDPLAQGEKIAFAKGSRANVDRILGTKANDLQALRGELQGEGGWNTAKLATVHGQPAAEALVGSVDRNLKFRDTYNKVVENSQTAQRNAAANAMKKSDFNEGDIITPSGNALGMGLTALKRLGLKATNSVMESSRMRARGEIAQALTEQGPARDQRLSNIIDALNQRQKNASMTAGGRRATDAVTAAMLAHQSNQQPTPRISPAVAKVVAGLRP